MRSRRVGDGADVLAIINANARKTSSRIVSELRTAIPNADIVFSQSIDDSARAFERHGASQRPLILSGGGDGTFTSLVNLLQDDGKGPPLGVLPLGTGNGLANAMRAGRYDQTVGRLSRLPLPPPTVHYDLVQVEGRRSHFAGTGWDARIIADYKRGIEALNVFPDSVKTNLVGYLYGLLRYTVPEEYLLLRKHGPAQVEITNLGPPAWTMDEQGKPVPLPGGETGSVIYAGPTSVCSVATSEEWGFHFRAHPNARKKPGWLNLRLYTRPVTEALRNVRRLWRGQQPQPGMVDFFVQNIRLRFSRPVPFQIGGDPMGDRTELEFSIAGSGIELVDWTH